MHTYSEKGEFLYHTSCPSCGSSDGNAVYDNGTTYCFVCNKVGTDDGEYQKKVNNRSNMGLLEGEVKELQVRNISKKTCGFYGYRVGRDLSGNSCQIADYANNDGIIVAQKLRYKDKSFKFIGEAKEAVMFGQHLFRSGGRTITITEGEIDALSVAEAFDCKYPVVSIPSGAQSARKMVAKNLDWLMTFEEVVLWFDMDEPGKKAVEEVVGLFPVGKVKVVNTNLGKDANEVLVKNGKSAVVSAFYEAKSYRPDGILTPEDLWEDLQKPVAVGVPWIFPKLTKVTYGRRKGEIYALGAGTGVGKTDFVTQQIVYDITTLNLKVGMFFLEQQPVESIRRLAGKIDGKLYHVPSDNYTQDDVNTATKKIIESHNLFLYNSFGSTNWDIIKTVIRSMVHNNGVEVVYLDHLTALASHAGDERRFIDGLMEEIASLANELQIIILFVSHLSTPEGKPHEEGGRVQAKHFRGSRSIQQWSYFMFGLERNQQHEDVEERKKSVLRVLKDRYTGQANGVTISIKYDTETGLLKEVDEDYSELFQDEEGMENDIKEDY